MLDQKPSNVSELTGAPGTAHISRHEPRSPSPRRYVESERLTFAARIRAGRAVLGWSQTELGKKARVTQRAIYRLEKAAVQARRLTQARIDKAFEDAGIGFAELPNGGFELDQKASDVSELTGMSGTAHVNRHELRSPSARRHVESERLIFAARMRAGRAVLGWSQAELGKKARVTQRAIYRLEKAAVQARRLTQARIDRAFEDAGIGFAQLPNGGFEMIVHSWLLSGSRQKAASQN